MSLFKLIWKIQSSPLMNQPRQLGFTFRSLVAREQAFWFMYQPYIWWTQMKRKERGVNPNEAVIHPDTELVIDGFQGSANSFATAAFQLSQTQPVKLANHLHSPVQIIQAIEQEIPVLLTIREPVGTMVSLTSRWPHVSVSQGLRSYISFYTKLKPYAPHYVVSTFEQTTQHIDRVVQTVNAKFNTNFDMVDVTEANSLLSPKSYAPEELARREPLKEKKRKELAAAKNAPLLEQANALYQTFEALAQQTVKR